MDIDFTANLKQEEAMNALQSEKYNFILFGGAIRGGKTVWGLSSLLVLCEVFPKSRWCIIRENSEKIRVTTIPSFSKLEPSGTLKQSPFEYHHPNGSVILFKSENYASDKELNWMRGLEVNGFLFEEINECQEQTLYKAFERAGSWSVPGRQPFPYVLATCNPSRGWVKTLIYDQWLAGALRDNWLYIPAKISDNIAHLDPVYIESLKNLPRYEYEVFVNGRWDVQLKTGGEFFKNFELTEHVRPLKWNQENTFHISVDSNVLPYIAISIWQMVRTGPEGLIWEVSQVHEIPARDPINTARKAGLAVGKWLRSVNYNQTVYLYGDPTTTARNNIDDEKKSFLDLFVEGIEQNSFSIEKRFFRKAPPVASTGDFINAIYEGKIPTIRVGVSEYCKESISDYIETKQDKDGGILKKRVTDPKTKQTYEPNGHMSDTKRYFLCKVFEDEFNTFQNRFSTHNEYRVGKPKQVY